MKLSDRSMNRQGKIPSQVYLLGVLILFMITSVSILHTNEYEFVWLRFEGITALQFSLFDTLLYMAYLVFGMLTGIVSDIMGRRRLFVIVGSSVSVLFFVLMTVTSSFMLLLLFRFLQGAFSVMCWQMLMTLTLDNADSGNRGLCMGVFGSFLALAMGTGPVLGGFLAKRSVFLPYYAATLLGIVVAVSAALLLKEPVHLRPGESLIDSLRVARQRPALLVPALFNFVDRLHIGFILFLLPLFLELRLGLGPSWRGTILGIHALPFILLQYPIGRLSDRVGRLPLLIPGTVSYGILISLAGYIGAQGPMAIAVSFFALGICSGLTGPPNAALVGDLVPHSENGMAMALFNFAGNLGIITGPLVAGWVMGGWNLEGAFLTAGFIELATLGICLSLLNRFRRYPAGAPRGSEK